MFVYEVLRFPGSLCPSGWRGLLGLRMDGIRCQAYGTGGWPSLTLMYQYTASLRTVITYHTAARMARKKKSVLNKRNLFQTGHTLSPNRRPTGYRSVTHRYPDGRIVLQGSVTKRDAPVRRPCKRYTQEEFDKIVKKDKSGGFTIPGPDGKEGAAIMLRPTKTDSGYPVSTDTKKKGPSHFPSEEGNILVEKKRLMEAINTAINAHRTLPCQDIKLDLVDFIPWGHYVKARVSCSNCTYQTEHKKLSEEAEKSGRGPKEATGNLRLQYLLQEMPIGNDNKISPCWLRPSSWEYVRYAAQCQQSWGSYCTVESRRYGQMG